LEAKFKKYAPVRGAHSIVTNGASGHLCNCSALPNTST